MTESKSSTQHCVQRFTKSMTMCCSGVLTPIHQGGLQKDASRWILRILPTLLILGLFSLLQAVSAPPLSAQTSQTFPNDTPPEDSRVAEIRIEGLDRLGTAEVLTRLKLKPGSIFSTSALDADYRRLWASGDFVSISPPSIRSLPEGVLITIRIEERKPVKEIFFEGSDSQSDKVLLGAIQTQIDELYDPLSTQRQ